MPDRELALLDSPATLSERNEQPIRASLNYLGGCCFGSYLEGFLRGFLPALALANAARFRARLSD